MAMCVHRNATEGYYHPQYGWPLCGTCFEDVKREAYETMPDVVVVYEYKSGRDWRTKEEWDESQWLKSSPNLVRKATYKKLEDV